MIRGDSALKTALTDPISLHLVQAPNDTDFPYIVHRFDFSSREPNEVMLNAEYIVDVWDRKTTAVDVETAGERLIVLLHNLQISPSGGEFALARFYYVADEFIPDDEEAIWHYALAFSVNIDKKSIITSLID